MDVVHTGHNGHQLDSDRPLMGQECGMPNANLLLILLPNEREK